MEYINPKNIVDLLRSEFSESNPVTVITPKERQLAKTIADEIRTKCCTNEEKDGGSGDCNIG